MHIRFRLTLFLTALSLIGSACGDGDSDAARFPAITASPVPTLPLALQSAVDTTCQLGFWEGIAEGSFHDGDGYTASELRSAVWLVCPDYIYEPLSPAEVTWCGNGYEFSRNYFNVIEAGIEAGIPSFRVVEPHLIAKARRGARLNDHETELLQAEIESMTNASGFDWDWARACRLTI